MASREEMTHYLQTLRGLVLGAQPRGHSTTSFSEGIRTSENSRGSGQQKEMSEGLSSTEPLALDARLKLNDEIKWLLLS